MPYVLRNKHGQESAEVLAGNGAAMVALRNYRRLEPDMDWQAIYRPGRKPNSKFGRQLERSYYGGGIDE